MKFRELGATGIAISEIGFGAWGIGGATPGETSYGPTDDEVSLGALRRAFDIGINFFDTSPVYGYGRSERLIGRAFRGARGEVVIATKGGLEEYGKPADFSPPALERALDESLRRLGTEYVDLYQLHNPPAAAIAVPALAAFVDRLRRAGKIRAFGVSVRAPADGSIAIDRLRPDAIQVNFNMMDQRALDDGLLDAARRARVSLIARTPLCFGFLSGRVDESSRFPEGDHRNRWPRAQLRRWSETARRMRACRRNGDEQTPAQFALRYCLSFPGVAAVIPGMMTPMEVDENAAAADFGPLSDAETAAIRHCYVSADLFDGAPPDPGKVDAAAAPLAAARGRHGA